MTQPPFPNSPDPAPVPLPLVVQLGFAGARELFDAEAHPGLDAAAFETAVEHQLAGRLERLKEELNLATQYFLCGISQIAIGGDTIFTRLCRAAGVPQRFFLSQPRDEYLSAQGSAGPDFTEDQKSTALALLASPHVIQEWVVSNAADRRERFHDVSLELVRVSDLLVCLVRASQQGKPGGTPEIIALAQKRRRPVLEIQIAVVDGAPVITEQWHGRDWFKPPALPDALAGSTLSGTGPGGTLPGIDEYGSGLKTLASRHANRERKFFNWAAWVIIGAHVLATLIAVVALTVHSAAIPWLLGIELLLLACGFGMHQYLHQTRRVGRWALNRIVAEVARSVAAIGPFHVYLEHLFSLPFPLALRPLLRTISVVHLRSTVATMSKPWEAQRDAYVDKRLVSVNASAQIPYNEQIRDAAKAWLKTARRIFISASVLAFIATLLKLLLLCICAPQHDACGNLTTVMGALAILLPVLAVAALSLTAAFDREARLHTSEEMLPFLHEQKTLLENASSAREYRRLLIETEARLLGETVNWYARRSFLGVA